MMKRYALYAARAFAVALMFGLLLYFTLESGVFHVN